MKRLEIIKAIQSIYKSTTNTKLNNYCKEVIEYLEDTEDADDLALADAMDDYNNILVKFKELEKHDQF